MSKWTLSTKKTNKINKIDKNIKLKIDYHSINPNDTYGFYLTNRTLKSQIKDLPMIGSFVDIYPKYFALDTEPALFSYQDVCVCYFKDEKYIDKIDGIYNAIIYKDIPLLRYYKYRYSNVKYFVPVDFSLCGDFDEDTLVHNLKRQAITFLWQTFELDGISFPLMTYGDESTLTWCFDHIMYGSNVCVSLKMVMKGAERELFLKALKVLVDTVHPKALIVYTVASIKATQKILEYAIINNIKIVEVPNTLMFRNRGERNG